MEWLERLNQALDYVEDHLAGEIDYGKAAQLACCSTYHFQRMFSYIAGVPLAEYIRRRRMTAAAFDLQRGDKVLEVALRYRYESPTSFNRAFQGVHGVAPSAAGKEGVPLHAYNRISFQISIKGEVLMNYRIESKGSFRIVGVKSDLPNDVDQAMGLVPKMWDKAASEGAIPRLCTLMEPEGPGIPGILGVSACMNNVDKWAYFVAVSSQKPLPQGMDDYIVPACTWAIFSGEGAMPLAIQELEKRAVTEWLPTSGYEYADAPDIEVYLNADPAHTSFEVWMPVTKKN